MSAPGADEPQGPGWWLASDGRYYPPADATASSDAANEPEAVKKAEPVKKKVVKKKAAAPKAAGTGTKKKVIKKKAASPRPAAKPVDSQADDSAADATNPDLAAKRPGQMKYTAKAPGTDQIAARRIQAKEQMVLLADARQQAALRLLSGLGDDPELAMAGVATRSIAARAERVEPIAPAEAPAPIEPLGVPEPISPEPDLVAPAEARVADAPTIAPVPPGDLGLTSPPPPVAPRAPAAAPPASPPMPGTPPPAPAPAPPRATPPPVPTPTAPPPVRRAEAMGTDVPFMEVKGSALGTDIDRIGERILIFADRVELRDRNNAPRQTIRYDQLSSVEVQKKIMGPTLLISSVAGATMTAKALRPELATGARAMIEKHAERFRRGEGVAAQVATEADAPAEAAPTVADPAPAPEPVAAAETAPTPALPPPTGAGRTHKSVLLAMLDELHSAGILSSDEVEMKRSLIELSDRS